MSFIFIFVLSAADRSHTHWIKIAYSLSRSDVLTQKNIYTQNMSLYFKQTISVTSICKKEKKSTPRLTLSLLMRKGFILILFSKLFAQYKNKQYEFVDWIFIHSFSPLSTIKSCARAHTHTHDLFEYFSVFVSNCYFNFILASSKMTKTLFTWNFPNFIC